MAIEYNSKLIDALYQTADKGKAQRIQEEMSEIGDPIFIYPLYAAYKKFKYASNAHYFISALNGIESREILSVMTEIVFDSEVEPLIYTYTLETFSRYEHFEPSIITKAGLILYQFSVNKRVIINLEALLSYLSKAGAISGSEEELKRIFESDEFDTPDRILSLSYLLNSNPKKWLQFYIDNFDTITNKPAEVLLSKALITRKGPVTEQLKNQIIQRGGVRAKEIMENAQKKQIKQKEELEKRETASYPNSKLITGIVELRGKINLLTLTNQNIKFNIFPQRETIYKQLEAATSEAVLRSYCLEFREFIQDVDESINTHGVSFDEALKIIPELQEQDFNKSINKLHLFLYSRKMSVDENLYGLRVVNRIVNLLAHPNNKESLTTLLRKLDMTEIYNKEDWISIHRKILDLYLIFLKKFHQELVNYSKPPKEEIAQE